MSARRMLDSADHELDIVLDYGISKLRVSHSSVQSGDAYSVLNQCKASRKEPTIAAKSILQYFSGDCTNTSVPTPAKNISSCCVCGSIQVIVKSNEALRVCMECDAIEDIVTDNERPAKREFPKDTAGFSFKRLSHFNEWLSQIQGKEHAMVPDSAIGLVMMELKKHNVVNASQVMARQIRVILKKLNMSRWYEHIPYIVSRIQGTPTDRLPPTLEDKLRCMFQKIQMPFVKYSPSTRKNFLSYSYVLHKFMELLGEDQYLPNFPLLKSREKLQVQDMIWCKICNELNWEYIPSI